jgi:hypothetical protein
MRKALFLIFVASCTSTEEKRAQYEIVYSKSTSPIKLEVNFENEPVIGKTAKLAVKGSISVDTDSFEITLSAPKGQQKPQKAWKGKLKKAEYAQMSHELFIDSNPVEITIVAKSEFSDGTRFVKEAHVRVNKTKEMPKGVPGKNSKGEDIIEFPQGK